MHGQLRVLPEPRQELMGARQDTEQAGVRRILVVGFLDDHSHLTAGVLQPRSYLQGNEIIRSHRALNAPGELPIIWDAGFMLGPPGADGVDSYVLGEINVSSVFLFPEEAPAEIGRLTHARLQGYCREYLRALAQRIEVDAKESSDHEIEKRAPAHPCRCVRRKSAGFGVLSFVPKWRAGEDETGNRYVIGKCSVSGLMKAPLLFAYRSLANVRCLASLPMRRLMAGWSMSSGLKRRPYQASVRLRSGWRGRAMASRNSSNPGMPPMSSGGRGVRRRRSEDGRERDHQPLWSRW
jgi:hypothetical protein